MSAVKYSWPTTRLHALLTRPGGKSRAEALAGAAGCLAECREDAEAGMAESLAAIDAIVADAAGRGFARGEIYAILQHTERLGAIAAMYEWTAMARVTRSMGELGMALLDAADRPVHPVAVHARAARWAAENSSISEDEARPVIDGLLRVLARFDARDAAERAREL